MISIYFILFSHIVQIQFTTVTATVGTASLLLFYLSEDEENVKIYLRNHIPGLLLFLIALCIRRDACVMLFPVWGLLGITKVIKNKKMLKSVAGYAVALILILGFLFVVEKLAYMQEPWKTYKEYNINRSQVEDYEGYPSYEEYKKLYDSFGVTEVSLKALSMGHMSLLDENMDADFMMAMSEVSYEKPPLQLTVLAEDFLQRALKSGFDRPMDVYVYGLYIYCIVLTLLAKKYKALYDLAALLTGRMVIWLYLMYIGRSVPRVTQGIFIMELFLLCAIFVKHQIYLHAKEKNKIVMRTATIVGLCVCMVIAWRFGAAHTNAAISYNSAMLQYGNNYKQMRAYFNEHPDNIYLGDVMSFSYFLADVWERPVDSAGNFILLGGWSSDSPWTERVADRYGIESFEKSAICDENVYFVFLDSDVCSYEYLEDYYQEKYPGSYFELADEVMMPDGNQFLILQIRQ